MTDDQEDDFYRSGNVRDQEAESRYDEESVEDHNYEEEREVLNGMTVDELLVKARKALLLNLLFAVDKGHATPQEMSVLAKLLKDNGMVMGDPLDDNQQPTSPPRDLPTFAKPEYLQ